MKSSSLRIIQISNEQFCLCFEFSSQNLVSSKLELFIIWNFLLEFVSNLQTIHKKSNSHFEQVHKIFKCFNNHWSITIGLCSMNKLFIDQCCIWLCTLLLMFNAIPCYTMLYHAILQHAVLIILLNSTILYHTYSTHGYKQCSLNNFVKYYS